MSTKTCPECNAEVPEVAQRCKHCFHDFSEDPPTQKGGLLVLLGFIAAMAIVGSGTFAYLFHYNASQDVIVDSETRDIVITRTSASGIETERIAFDSVAKIQHVTGGDEAMIEVVVVTKEGNRYVIKESDDTPQTGHAQHVAAKVGVEVETVNTLPGWN